MLLEPQKGHYVILVWGGDAWLQGLDMPVVDSQVKSSSDAFLHLLASLFD